MCLAIPGEVIRWIEREPPFCQAEVKFLGIKRVCNLSCVPDANVGDYVVVHAGIAISIVGVASVTKLLAELTELDIQEELKGDSP